MPAVTIRKTVREIDELPKNTPPEGFSAIWEFTTRRRIPRPNLMRCLSSNISVTIIRGEGELIWFDDNQFKHLPIKEGDTIDIPKNEDFCLTSGNGNVEGKTLHLIFTSPESKPMALRKTNII